MANVYATKTGNWSDITVWNTGSLPTASDDVYANTYTVTIDQDVTVLSIRNTSATGITSGGTFIVNTTRTLTVTGLGIVGSNLGNTLCMTLAHGAGDTVTINGNITGGTAAGSTCMVSNSAGALNITGTITGGSSPSNAQALNIGGVCTVTVTGNLQGGTGGSNAISCSSGATINVTGTVTGGPSNGGHGISCTSTSAVTVTGNVTGGAGSQHSNGVISTNGGGTVSITGTLTAQGMAAIAGSSVYTVTGPFIASASGILPTATTGVVKLSAITGNEFRFKSSGAGTVSLWSTDVNGGQPAASNVRSGVTYGVGGALTGTCAVPVAASVGYGVPVDNTTGTAALSPADVAALVGAQIAAALNATP